MERPLIAVSGATGMVGSRIAARLIAAGVRPRLVVRDRARVAADLRGDVREAAGYGARDEMRAALSGVDTLVLIPAAESTDRVDQHRAAVDAARDAAVRRVIYVSFLGAAPDATFLLARDHWATEEHLRASGLTVAFLRMSLYLDFMPSMVSADGRLAGPAGQGRVAPILRADVAEAAAAVALTDVHDGGTYDLTGPAAFTLAEAAGRMAEASGKPVHYVDESDEEALASRRGSGAPDWEIRGWISSYQAIRDGSLSTVSADFEHITGRPAVGLDGYLGEQPDALDHVSAAGH